MKGRRRSRRMRRVLGTRIGCGPPGVSAAPAPRRHSIPTLAPWRPQTLGCTLAGQIKEGGRKNATAVRRLRRRRRMKEMLTGRIYMGGEGVEYILKL